MNPLPPHLQQLHLQLRDNLPYYAKHALKIKDKDGHLVPFIFNSAQEYLHGCIEKQLKELGYVRAIIVKGRQQGCSTYAAARYYHQATWREGKGVFILSHESKTTMKLFDIVERFYNHTPEAIKPSTNVANRQTLKFDKLDSEYSLGTAGNANVARGVTVQLFHGSEVAFWEQTDGIRTGVLQTIPLAPNTEIIHESTANGMGNMFYRLTMEALKGKNDFQVIFIPWYWQVEYRRSMPPDGQMTLTPDEVEYKELYKLDNPQMYWRRSKIAELQSEWMFKQEYPAFLQEAFQTSGETLISAEQIFKARKSNIKDPAAPTVMGVDPGRNGDRTTFVYRRGRELIGYEEFRFDASDNVQMTIAGMIIERIKSRGIAKVFVDVGHGYGVCDRIRELGYGTVVTQVNFGSRAIDAEIYTNKRAEMWCKLRDWLHGEDGEVSIPDDDNLQLDLTLVPAAKINSSGRTQLVPKDQIRAKSGFSPDIGDGAALTFAYPVSNQQGVRRIGRVPASRHKRPLKTLQRVANPDSITQKRMNLWSHEK